MAASSADELRAEVARRYASRVARYAPEDLLPVVDGGSGGEDGAACCAPAGEEVPLERVAALYRSEDLEQLSADVLALSFGCGNPTAIAALQPGEVVLDLGSGAGLDVLLAARQVGPEGFVYGVDMTPEMVALARRNAAAVGAENVEFRLGTIEELPFADATIDVIISNCVINLSPDKDAVFREAFRVLRPGGRLQVSDTVWLRERPEAQLDLDAWASCVAGALTVTEYEAKLRRAGFLDVEIRVRPAPGEPGFGAADIVARKPGPRAMR